MSAISETRGNKVCLNCFADREAHGVCPQCSFTGESLRPGHALPAGTRLQGRYLTGRMLSGMCNEFTLGYRAIDFRSNALVAIREYFPREFAKRLQGTAIAGPGSAREASFYSLGLKAFLGEARELRALFNPHVIPIRHIFEENGTAYVVESHCDAQSIANYLRQSTAPVTEAEALKLITPVLDALAVAHHKNLLHLDIRPERILIRNDYEPVLVGFSGARIALAERTLSLVTLPSSPFAAVERYLSLREMGPWTDVYSVAALLYRLLTGEDPPEAADRAEMDSLLPIMRQNPACSLHIAEAVEWGLRFNRKDRPQTIAEFRRALFPHVAGHERDDLHTEPLRKRPEKVAVSQIAQLGFVLGGLVYVAILSYIGYTSLASSQNRLGAEQTASEQSTKPLRAEQPRAKSIPPPTASQGPASLLREDAKQATLAPPASPLEQRTPDQAHPGTPEDWLRRAQAYENGKGVPVNIREALKWYQRAAEQNEPEAQTALGRLYLTGKAGPHKQSDGVHWYRRAAEQGFPDAQFALGALYELGVAIRQDMSEALRWYRAAADSGHPMAQNRLGKLYDEGQGVPADNQAAVLWYRRAAEQGDSDAQYNLALMYENGEGVAADRAEALAWLERAAAGGHGDALALLKKLRATR